jgi:hypothetical protein
METGIIKKQREARLKRIRELPPGPEALKELAYLREEYDCSNEDYLNALKILSDTTYQDRKHFLLELIQNADDADYSEKEAQIRFIIKKYNLELRYNEVGFDTNDVIAITGAGASTKTKKRSLSQSFIGEKGIGFKSVFALASEVEIESPPWNFTLRKEKPVVPQVLTNKKLKEPHGTRIEVHFEKPDSINEIAEELFRFVNGKIESFLFLQKLAIFFVEDHRQDPIQKCSVEIKPSDRSGKFLQLQTFPDNQKRTYFFYSEEIEFSQELVAERWENLGSKLGNLRRKIIVAIPQTEQFYSSDDGSLFCFLPTQITLPVPLFLHVDGVTTADRERLQNPEDNNWNRYLFSKLPQILLNSIFEMRKHSNMADCIPNYIPITPGTDQLQNVFESLISRLHTEPWIRLLNTEKFEWATPEEVVEIDEFWIPWFEKYPKLKSSAEEILERKFVHPKWTASEKWSELKKYYNIPSMTSKQAAQIIAECNLPMEFTQDESTFVKLYSYICEIIEKTEIFSVKEIQAIILKSQIFPLEGGKFGALHSENNAAKTYWVSERTPKKTGLDNIVEFSIINPEYTYKPKIGQDFSDKKKTELEQIDIRNNIVRSLLEKLEIKELDDEQILSDLQIPWLLNPKRTDDEQFSKLYNVLYILFGSFRAKRTTRDDEDYLNQLSKISQVEFPSINGPLHRLEELLLPEVLRLEKNDNLYSESGLETLKLPQKLLKLSKNDIRDNDDKRELDKKTKKWNGEWRLFLVRCGIKIKPKFEKKSSYYHPSYFMEKDQQRFNIWTAGIDNNYTWNNWVTVTIIDLDESTKKLIENKSGNLNLLSSLIFSIWKEQYGDLAQKDYRWREENIVPGKFHTKYLRRSWYDRLFQDYLWAGVDRHNIPLNTLNDKVTTSKNARRIFGSYKGLQRTWKYFDLVSDTDDDNGEDRYKLAYYNSLNVEKLSTGDINQLWEKADEKKYDDIIQVAIECVKADLIFGGSLEIFDKEEKRPRPVTDFYLGKQAPKGTPLIEKQYGESGRELGNLLKLPIEDDAQVFVGVFDKILSKKFGVQTIKSGEKFYNLLNNWSKWNDTSKQLIKDDLEGSLKKYDIALYPFIIFNNPEIANVLKNIEAIVLNLEIKKGDRPKLKKLAKDLGLIFPETYGQLLLEGVTSLSYQEFEKVKEISKALTEYYEEDALEALYEKLQPMGEYENLGQKIRKIDFIKRKITVNKEYFIPLKTPLFQEEEQLFYISKDLDEKGIITELFSYFGFAGRKSQTIKDINDALSVHKAKGKSHSSIPNENTPTSLEPKNIPSYDRKQNQVDARPDHHEFTQSEPSEQSLVETGFSNSPGPAWMPDTPVENIPISYAEYHHQGKKGRIIGNEKGSSGETDTDVTPKDHLSQADRDAIGEAGEKYALLCCLQKKKEKYPDAEIEKISDDHYCIVKNQDVISEIWRRNRPGHIQEKYDIEVNDDGITEYIEVKSTIDESKDVFYITDSQWAFAQEKGDLFQIYRVYNTGKEQAKAEIITNPYKMWSDKEIDAKFDVRLYI